MLAGGINTRGISMVSRPREFSLVTSSQAREPIRLENASIGDLGGLHKLRGSGILDYTQFPYFPTQEKARLYIL